MEDLIILKDCPVTLDKKQVLEWMDCREDSPVYEEISGIYDEEVKAIAGLCAPVILLKFGILESAVEEAGLSAGVPVVYGLSSIGAEISRRSTQAFAEGDALLGMMINAIADTVLFGMEALTEDTLRKECAARGKGILWRLEAPQDMPMEMQRTIHQKTEAEKRCQIQITSAFMFDPVKSNGMMFLLTEDGKVFHARHDCRSCGRMDCKKRKIPDSMITVKEPGQESYEIKAREGQSLLEALTSAQNSFSAVCGGRGICGKCKVRLVSGELPQTKEDKRYFSREELDKGWRLACRAIPKEDIAVELAFRREAEMEVLSTCRGYGNRDKKGIREPLAIAIDIGTTTLAFQLVGLLSKNKIYTCTGLNRQRAYGADVISRIQRSVEGQGEELRQSIREDLSRGIRSLVKESGADRRDICRIAIAANTTMVHLLMGYSCDALGVFPFLPVTVQLTETGSKELLNDDYLDVPVVILPGVSTYVGGDIVSGMLACGFDRSDQICLLVDLGTNGEMAIGGKDKILTTSTAAGPAFEGGNIRWGTGSIPGAICSVTIQGEQAECKTIADKSPVGICGTGVIETTAELLRTGMLEDNGHLDEAWFLKGFPLAVTEQGERIVFTQQDIREIQLAKSAVRAGIETLMLRFGAKAEQIHRVYLAGGFGFSLDMDKAISIGMLPGEFRGRLEAVGNSSLGGAVKFLTEKDGARRLGVLTETAREINLSADPDFNELYMEYMFFE